MMLGQNMRVKFSNDLASATYQPQATSYTLVPVIRPAEITNLGIIVFSLYGLKCLVCSVRTEKRV